MQEIILGFHYYHYTYNMILFNYYMGPGTHHSIDLVVLTVL